MCCNGCCDGVVSCSMCRFGFKKCEDYICVVNCRNDSMTYDDSNRDAKAPQFSCADGTNFTFTNSGKAHTGTLEKSGEKYILHYSDSNKTMEATISGKQMTIVISGSDSMRLVFETK